MTLPTIPKKEKELLVMSFIGCVAKIATQVVNQLMVSFQHSVHLCATFQIGITLLPSNTAPLTFALHLCTR
jgi:hypothetical protein